MIGAERILSRFQVKGTAGPLYGWTLQSQTWAGSTLWSWPNIFSGEHILPLPNWPIFTLAYKCTVLPMLEGEGSSDSYIWPHSVLLLTFWTTYKNMPSHFKLGIFYLQFKLYVYVRGQKSKLLSFVQYQGFCKVMLALGACLFSAAL